MNNIIDRLSSLEEGNLNQEETIELFQELIDSSLILHLERWYVRMAEQLIELGHCTDTHKSIVRG